MDPEHPVASGTAPTRTGLPFGPCQVPLHPHHEAGQEARSPQSPSEPQG